MDASVKHLFKFYTSEINKKNLNKPFKLKLSRQYNPEVSARSTVEAEEASGSIEQVKVRLSEMMKCHVI